MGGQDVWSTGGGYHGDPDAKSWEPKFCDPQLFQQHIWFWEPNLAVRDLATMIPIYHDIVGRGMVMELAFSIDRDGLVQDTHAAVYAQLGAWVRECYGSPVGSASGTGEALAWRVYAPFDRVQLEEDVALGQRIRNYTLELQPAEGAPWQPLASGGAVGRKRIVLLGQQHAGNASLRLRVTRATAPPVLKLAAAFAPCRTG